MANLREKLKEEFISRPNRIAIQYKRNSEWIDVDYRTFERNIKSLSSYLLEQGIKKDDKIGIILENGPLWPLAFFSSISIGAIAVPIGAEYTQKEVENILKNS
ncbi:unnamed protein product, partial [marine sediment metagenome]